MIRFFGVKGNVGPHIKHPRFDDSHITNNAVNKTINVLK